MMWGEIKPMVQSVQQLVDTTVTYEKAASIYLYFCLEQRGFIKNAMPFGGAEPDLTLQVEAEAGLPHTLRVFCAALRGAR